MRNLNIFILIFTILINGCQTKVEQPEVVYTTTNKEELYAALQEIDLAKTIHNLEEIKLEEQKFFKEPIQLFWCNKYIVLWHKNNFLPVNLYNEAKEIHNVFWSDINKDKQPELIINYTSNLRKKQTIILVPQKDNWEATQIYNFKHNIEVRDQQKQHIISININHNYYDALLIINHNQKPHVKITQFVMSNNEETIFIETPMLPLKDLQKIIGIVKPEQKYIDPGFIKSLTSNKEILIFDDNKHLHQPPILLICAKKQAQNIKPNQRLIAYTWQENKDEEKDEDADRKFNEVKSKYIDPKIHYLFDWKPF